MVNCLHWRSLRTNRLPGSCPKIDEQRPPDTNLSSAIRLRILEALSARINDEDTDS